MGQGYIRKSQTTTKGTRTYNHHLILQLAHAEAKYTELLVEMKSVKQENFKLKQRIEQLERAEIKNSREEEKKPSRLEQLRKESEEKKKQEEEYKLMEAERALNARQLQLQQLQAEKLALQQQQQQQQQQQSMRSEYNSYQYTQPSAPPMSSNSRSITGIFLRKAVY